jgi:hypothetical protein
VSTTFRWRGSRKLSAGKLNAELNAAGWSRQRSRNRVTWNPERTSCGVYFAICVLGVLALTALAGGGESMADRRLAAALIGAMSVWYAVFGRHLIDRDAPLWQGLLFQGVLFVLFFTAMYAVGVASFLLFGLCPLVYMTLHTWVGHGVVALYAFAPALLALAFGDPTALGATLPLGAVIFGISVVIAVTTARMERVSAERGHLIEELNETRAEVARLSRDAGIADERQRLAGEIHDTVAQGLSSVVMLVEAADAELVVDVAKARAPRPRRPYRTGESGRGTGDRGGTDPAPLAGSTLVDAIDRCPGATGPRRPR